MQAGVQTIVVSILGILSSLGGNHILVAGLTLTLWIPGQTLFASTSSYASLEGCLYDIGC